MTLINLYNRQLTKRPLATKMATNFAICCLGDSLCQILQKKSSKFQTNETERNNGWNIKRSLMQGVVGAGLQTPLLHFYLTRFAPHVFMPNSVAIYLSQTAHKFGTVSLKLAAHTLLVLPTMQTLFFLGMGTLRSGGDLNEGIKFWKQNVKDGIQLALCFWPIIQVGLYTFVPLHYGNLYMDSFNLLFQVSLSYLTNRHRNSDNYIQNSNNNKNLQTQQPSLPVY